VSFYFDASAILPMFVAEASSGAVAAFAAAVEESLVVGEFAAAETASGLSRLVRMGDLTLEAAGARLADFDAWRAAFCAELDLEASDVRSAAGFVRRFELGLRAPDALHLAACRRGDHVLVTLDRRLAAAAEALGVRVEWLGAG
jgi:uncharacterized protein